MKFLAPTFIALSLLLSGCGAKAEVALKSSAPVATASHAQASPSATPIASTANVPTASADPSPSPTVSAAKDQPGYYVNPKTFRIMRSDGSTWKKGENKIAMVTIDDGPRDKKIDEKLLDILDKYHAKAIWFVNGYRFADSKGNIQESGAALLREIKARGHIIGNHTQTHENLKDYSKKGKHAELFSQVKMTSDEIEKVLGERPVYFRHPFGAYNDESVKVVTDLGMQHMNWSVGSMDWVYKDPQKVIKQTLTTMHDGAVILFHDLPQTTQALEPILKQLTADGYTFVVPTEVRLNK